MKNSIANTLDGQARRNLAAEALKPPLCPRCAGANRKDRRACRACGGTGKT